jgi:hypothetical protein
LKEENINITALKKKVNYTQVIVYFRYYQQMLEFILREDISLIHAIINFMVWMKINE